jgi:integrase
MQGWDPMATARKRGKVWYVRYRDAHGKQIETKAGPDRSVAQRIANGLESQVQAIKAGTADSREQKWAEAERKPLSDHVEAWQADMLARGLCTQYALETPKKVSRIIESTRAQRISQLTLSGVTAALAELRSIPGRLGNEGLSDRSLQRHAVAIKTFTRWLWRDERVREDPMAHLPVPRVITSRTRSALEAGEAARLLELTPSGPVRGAMPAEDRAMLYAIALGTGFRARECKSLTRESFNLDTDQPTITCRASHTKNHKPAVQPIRPELAAMLRLWLARKPPRETLFHYRIQGLAGVLRDDLQDAGVVVGEDFGFHGLRHTYITTLVKSGANIKVVQTLARHSTAAMTLGVYSHVSLFDVRNGLEGLAHILPTPAVSKSLTGTDGHAAISSPGRSQVDPSRHTCQRPSPSRWR